MSRLSHLLIAVFALSLAPGANAQWSSASVFTDDGVEIGVEPRVFAVFALLNGAGYDKETVFGPAPLERPGYSQTREKLRANVGRSSNKPIFDLIAANPGTVEQYIEAALQLGPAPRFDATAATSPLAKALAPALREWFNEEGGSSLVRNANEEVKGIQKHLLPIIDKAVKGVGRMVRLGDVSEQLLDDAGAQGRVALMLNELDAHGARTIHIVGDTTGVFVGPFRGTDDETAAVDAVIFAFTNTMIVGEVNKLETKGTLADGYDTVLDVVKKTWTTPKDWSRALLACAVSREVLARAAACPGLVGDARSDVAMALIAPRLKEFAPTTTLFSAALPDLLAAPPPPPPPEAAPAPEEPKGKGKNKK